MEYRYKKNQIFKKKLNVPVEIRNKVYASILSIEEFQSYDLVGKLPVSCLDSKYREIAEIVGIEQASTLDWDFILADSYWAKNIIKENYGKTEKPIMDVVYQQMYEEIINRKRYYGDNLSEGFKTAYPRLFLNANELPEEVKDSFYSDSVVSRNEIIGQFYSGNISPKELYDKWEIFKNKDLGRVATNYAHKLTGDQLREFISEVGFITWSEYQPAIYDVITKLNSFTDETAKHEFLTDYVKSTIKKVNASKREIYKPTEYTNEEYRTIFKYISLDEYLSIIDFWRKEDLNKMANNYGLDNILNTPFPFKLLTDSGILNFVSQYGLKNIMEFDTKSGGFFSNNNWEYLKTMDDMYMHYAGNVHDKKRTLSVKPYYDKNGNYIDREYTKEEFNEVIRRMIIFGPTNSEYRDKALDYRRITGEYRELNPDLFVDEMLPETFKSSFYTGSLTPEMIYQNPEFIEYLRGKNLGSCFKELQVQVKGDKDGKPTYDYFNVYQLLLSKVDYNTTMEIISNYASLLEPLFHSYDRLNKLDQIESLLFNDTDDIGTIKTKMNEKILELILKTNIKYSANLPQDMKQNHPSIFMNNNAPKELQEKMYRREISATYLAEHPEYKEFLKGIDIEVLFKPINVSIDESTWYWNKNLINIIKEVCGNETGLDVLFAYGKYLDVIDVNNDFGPKLFSYNMTPDEMVSKLEDLIYSSITKGQNIYDDKMPQRFKNKYPFLFLPQDTPTGIKEKFYTRKITLQDFKNPELINYFSKTDIACALDPSYSWLIGLFKGSFDHNDKKLKILSEFTKINDVLLQNIFRDYITYNIDSIQMDKINQISDVLFRLSYSNSSEMLTFRTALATQLLLTDNPLDSLNKIEDIFLRNNIPSIGKIFSVFQILHPNTYGFDFSENSKISPVLKNKSSTGKQITIFSDLLKASFGSNNRSIKTYLENMEQGNKLFSQVASGSFTYEQLDNPNKQILTTFIAHLNTLYNNTVAGKKEGTPRAISENNNENINELARLFSTNGNLDYDLSDRIIKMFCYFAGFSTYEQAKNYFIQKPKSADEKNRAASRKNFTLEQGDFLKGVGDIKYLKNILQNGSVAREFLGSSAGSDLTPLDTDLSRIISPSESIADAISKTEASSYGPIWFVLKNDERFTITRKSPNETDQTIDTQTNTNKLEAFYTGAIGNGHYGIRTGFASSEIDYIVAESYDKRIGLELAMNGFYIPVVDKTGKLIFSTQEYDEIRTKMAGLTYFEARQYNFANNLLSPATEELANVIPESVVDVSRKHNAINNVLAGAAANIELKLKIEIDGDLTEGSIELIDTGSTGRGTNMPGDSDFDFMMRLDKKIIANPEKLRQVKETLLKSLGRDSTNEITGNGDFRLKNILIDGLDTPVDIDITFVEKTDKLAYSTEMALSDRLKSIKEQSPEKYPLVVANILLAKRVLKEAGVYKPNRGEVPQGGLGGVGIENWVLQNGGSFEQAAMEFLNASNDKTFEDFKKDYAVWDFGENHLASKNGYYPHDNFVERNMSQDGYLKMKQVLTEYCKNIEYQQTESIQR